MKLLYGLIAGAIAAVVASLVQLPLESPDDVVFNAGTVTAGALVAGLVLGVVWMGVSRAPNGMALYAGAAALLFAVSVAFALVMETQLDRSIEYIVTLAVIVIGIAAPLVIFLSMAPEVPNTAQYGGTVVALVAAIAIGGVLAGRGDEESGELALPDVEANPTAAPGETAVASGQPLTAEDVAGLTYTVGEGSELTYTVTEQLANLPSESDAVGRTNALSGSIRLDGETSVQGDMSTLTSDQSRRDGAIQNRVFQGDSIVSVVIDGLELPDQYVPGETFATTLSADTTVVGVTQALTYDIEARLVGDELQVLATTDFTWDMFNIDPPNVAGLVTVQDNVHIEVLLIAIGA